MSAGATVTQADRDAAASITAMAELREMVAGGDYDEHAYIQAFARYRLATAAEFAAREAALVEALRNLSDRWFLNGGELTAPAYVEAKALIARAHTTSEGEG